MSERPQIVVGELPATVDAAIAALAPLDVYQRAGALVDVVHEVATHGAVIRPDGSPRVRLLPIARLRELLELGAAWVKVDGRGEVRGTRVPKDVVAAVEARGEWPHIRPLSGVVEWPVLRPDGTVLTARGYDAQTRLLCAPTVAVKIPERPTLEDAQHAVEHLRELTVDFPFESPAHFAAWAAELLTILARPAIDGPVPLGLHDGNARGVGKSILADLIGVIVTGRVLPRRTVPEDAAEWKKTMLAIAIAADPVLLIDNVTRLLASDALDAVLTGTSFRQRVLGKNEELSLPIQTVFICTANNAAISADLVRRSLHIRLETSEEQPERRTGWQYPDLLGYAREHRAQLLGAAFTILRGYVVAGRPRVELLPMGSYDAWSAVVRAPLVWAGLSDPATTQEGLQAADTERDAIGELLRTWHAHYGDRAVTVAEVLAETDRDSLPPAASAVRMALLGFCEGNGGKLPSVRKLGNALARLRGRLVGGRLIERATKGEHGVRWRVRATAAADSADSADSEGQRSCVRERVEGSSKQSHESHESQGELPDWGLS